MFFKFKKVFDKGQSDKAYSFIFGADALILAAMINVGIILVRPLGSTGIWLATSLAWATGAAAPVIRICKLKTKKLV